MNASQAPRRRFLQWAGGTATAAMLLPLGCSAADDNGVPGDAGSDSPGDSSPGDSGSPLDTAADSGADSGGPVDSGEKDTAPVVDTGAKPPGVLIGKLSEFPVGTFKFVGRSMVLGHDAGGLYVMTSICTHSSCDMTSRGTASATGLDCGCHGSAFDKNGAVTAGPARAPLNHFAVALDPAKDVYADTATKVPAATRTPAG